MNNTIHIGGTLGLSSLISGMQKKVSHTVNNLSYQDMLASLQADSASETAAMKSAADMTMEEFQTYIWQ